MRIERPFDETGSKLPMIALVSISRVLFPLKLAVASLLVQGCRYLENKVEKSSFFEDLMLLLAESCHC